MDESRKKPIMLGVTLVCFVLAGVIYLRTRGSSGPNLERFRGEMTWILCRNPDCKHAWEMDLEQYHKFMLANADPRVPVPPPITCPKCNEPSGYRAVKCAKCGLIFERGSVRADFADRCPNEDCGYSQSEEDRKRAMAGAKQPSDE